MSDVAAVNLYPYVNLTVIKWSNCLLNCVSGIKNYLDEMANDILAFAVTVAE
jgi:hypothetical protein